MVGGSWMNFSYKISGLSKNQCFDQSLYFFRVSPRSLMQQVAILGSSPDLNAAASHYGFSGYFN